MSTWQDAVLAVLEAADTNSPVLDGHVPDSPPYRYAVFYPDGGKRENSTVCGSAADGVFRFQVTTVVSENPSAPGNVRRQCTWLSNRFRDALLGLVIVCDGWVCGPVEQTLTLPVRSDDSLPDRSSVIAVDQYVIHADRTG
jgi:hypothetical protein